MSDNKNSSDAIYIHVKAPLSLAADTNLFTLHQDMIAAFGRIAEHVDPVYRRLALGEIRTMVAQLDKLVSGQITFSGTEAF